jgi:hypothetical protein
MCTFDGFVGARNTKDREGEVLRVATETWTASWH